MIIPQAIHLHMSTKYLAKVQNALLLTVFVKSTAESFVGIFIPIYLLTHGLSLRDVFAYCLLVFAITFASMLVALKSNQYIGMKKTMLAGIMMTIGFYMALHGLTSGIDYRLIAIVEGVSLGFYFGAYNMLLTKAIKRGREGRGTSVQQITGIFAGVIGPTIGAFVIKGLSFQSLFLIITVLLIIAPIPLFFTKEIKAKKQSLQFLKLCIRKPTRADRAVFTSGIIYASGTFWPVYIYLHYPHLTALGILATITSGVAIIVTYVIGSMVDKRQRLAYRLGGLLYAPTWLSRLLFLTPLGLGINSLVGSILAIGPTMAVNKDIFHIAKTSTNQTAHFVRVELYMDGGRACLFALALVLPNLTILFVITSLAALAFVSCAPKRRRSRQPVYANAA